MKRQYAQDVRDIAELNKQFLKPKPRWIPMWVYIKILKIFIRIN